MGETIYKKQFHRETPEEIETKPSDFIRDYEGKVETPSFEEIMKEIYSNVSYLVLPEREKRAKDFIKTAIEISNDYEVDIEIKEHLSHISVTYFFDCCAGMGFLKSLSRCPMIFHSLSISGVMIWPCLLITTSRLCSKEVASSSPNGQT